MVPIHPHIRLANCVRELRRLRDEAYLVTRDTNLQEPNLFLLEEVTIALGVLFLLNKSQDSFETQSLEEVEIFARRK